MSVMETPSQSPMDSSPLQQGGSKFPWKVVIPVGCIGIIVCLLCVGGAGYYVYTQTDTLKDLGISTEPDIIPADATPVAAEYPLGDMVAFLADHNGVPCE